MASRLESQQPGELKEGMEWVRRKENSAGMQPWCLHFSKDSCWAALQTRNQFSPDTTQAPNKRTHLILIHASNATLLAHFPSPLFQSRIPSLFIPHFHSVKKDQKLEKFVGWCLSVCTQAIIQPLIWIQMGTLVIGSFWFECTFW